MPRLNESFDKESLCGGGLRYVYLPESDFETLCVAVHVMYTGCLWMSVETCSDKERIDALKTDLERLGFTRAMLDKCQVDGKRYKSFELFKN